MRRGIWKETSEWAHRCVKNAIRTDKIGNSLDTILFLPCSLTSVVQYSPLRQFASFCRCLSFFQTNHQFLLWKAKHRGSKEKRGKKVRASRRVCLIYKVELYRKGRRGESEWNENTAEVLITLRLCCFSTGILQSVRTAHGNAENCRNALTPNGLLSVSGEKRRFIVNDWLIEGILPQSQSMSHIEWASDFKWVLSCSVFSFDCNFTSTCTILHCVYIKDGGWSRQRNEEEGKKTACPLHLH